MKTSFLKLLQLRLLDVIRGNPFEFGERYYRFMQVPSFERDDKEWRLAVLESYVSAEDFITSVLAWIEVGWCTWVDVIEMSKRSGRDPEIMNIFLRRGIVVDDPKWREIKKQLCDEYYGAELVLATRLNLPPGIGNDMITKFI